jgi:hypothetical protein
MAYDGSKQSFTPALSRTEATQLDLPAEGRPGAEPVPLLGDRVMISRPRYALAAATLAVATAGLLSACGDTEETVTPGTGGQGAATSTGGSGAQAGSSTGGTGGTSTGTGGSGAQAGSSNGGSGGGLSSTDVCMQACEAIVACGGAGGGGPTLPDCVAPCYELLDSCSQDELAEVLACMAPHLDPNCDDETFFACVNAVACTS